MEIYFLKSQITQCAINTILVSISMNISRDNIFEAEHYKKIFLAQLQTIPYESY